MRLQSAEALESYLFVSFQRAIRAGFNDWVTLLGRLCQFIKQPDAFFD
jgi:hypothetical protein